MQEEISRIAQACFQGCPVIVLGSGASMTYGLPSMSDLSVYLRDKIKTENQTEEDEWLLVRTALENGDHLEAALSNKRICTSLVTKIVEHTWRCINEKDRQLLELAATNADQFPLGKLLVRLFSSTNIIVNLVTTNYDRVAEFACNSSKILFQTGFTHGYIQQWGSNNQANITSAEKKSRVVKIWKVHGSLDWFRIVDDQTIGMPVFELPSPSIFTPLIVTPGLDKFEKTYEDPFRTVINGADGALKNAAAFLCVGFGFRDQHIHPKIIERCREKNVPTVVLARTLTNEAKAFLKNKAGRNYLGIEKTNTGSRVYSCTYPDGVDVAMPDLWSLEGFNSLVL